MLSVKGSRLGHGLSNCTQLPPKRISKISENPPYSLALKAESKLFGKESIKFNAWIKKVGAQCSYTGGEKAAQISIVEVAGDNNEMGVTGIWGITGRRRDEWGRGGADEAQKG
ncbi:hypothetical protein Golax_022166 [Gossypium laxum]|uniref:Uncharacterized protein n=1 Tax=Gossypium laxum TaxID=34288 RepID=A0A7J9ANB7_9ROSI|nr:hypothetical protein [Gossypium laxum]